MDVSDENDSQANDESDGTTRGSTGAREAAPEPSA